MESRRVLPSGTVTFLVGDIKGSTRLVREPGDAYTLERITGLPAMPA